MDSMPTKKSEGRNAQSTQQLLNELNDFLGRMQADVDEMERRIEVSEARTDLIREMHKAILRSTFSPKEVLELIIRKCLSKTGSRHGQVVQYRRNRLVVTASSEPGRVHQELPLKESLCGKAVIEGKTQHYGDLSEVPSGKYVRYHEETKSELVVLIKPENSARVLGVLDLERDEIGEFDPTSVAFAELLAGQAAIAIGHARTWSGAKLLYEISTSLLSGNLTLEESYQNLLEAILERFDFEHGQILRLIGDEFVILASSSKEDIGLRPGKDTSVCGRYLIAQGERDILVIDDIENSRYREFYLGLLRHEGRSMRSEMIVPLIDNERLIGALNIESPEVDIFSDIDETLLGLVGSLMATAISATLARTTRANRERTEAATLALTQLGNVAQSFLHRFANNIGDARGRLLELNEFLADRPLPDVPRRGVTVTSFIAGVAGTLAEGRKIIDDFSNRFNPGDLRFRIQKMDVKLIAASALASAKSRYEGYPIDFRFEDRIPSTETRTQQNVGGLSVCHLSEQVYEVVDNLLDNAVEAILARGPDFAGGQVIVLLDLPDPLKVRLQISDNGIGIPDADKHLIFKFGTTRKKGKNVGIGLWFCDLYVRQRGGKIEFDSVAGKGATFEVEFPTVLADAPMV